MTTPADDKQPGPPRLPVSLVPVTRANWQAVIALRPSAAQAANLASNLYSLAEAYVEPGCTPLAVRAGDTVVGFVMHEYLPARGCYNIPRYMIDAAWQGRGYGRAGLAALLAQLDAERPEAGILISLRADNEGARRVYERLGFVDTGETVHGEIVMRR